MFGLFGPSMRGVFASRWKALLWAGGVLLTAYCTIPASDEEEAAPVVTPEMAAALATKAPPPPKHSNPWAKDAR